MKQKYINLAKKQSAKADYHHQLGAVIIKKNRVLSVGYNKPYKTHTKSPNKFKTIHAEFSAICLLSAVELKGATIYVFRNAKSGPRMAKPCKCCMDLIRKVGIKKVIYSTNSGLQEELTF